MKRTARARMAGALLWIFLCASACSERRLENLLLPGGAGRPVVLASLPAAGATGTGSLQEVWVLFSEAMDEQKTQSAFRLSAERDSLQGSFRWEGTKLLFRPQRQLVGGEHTLVVGRDAESIFGADLHDDFVARFLFGVDASRPKFVSSAPGDGGNLAPNASVVFSFSEPVRFDSLDDGIRVTPPFAYTLIPGADRTSVVVRPNAPLLPGNYLFTLSEAILDDEGNALSAAESIRLTVGTDFAPPTAAAVRLGSLALVEGRLVTGGERTDDLVITFSEAMDPVSSDGVSVSPFVPFNPVWNGAGTELTLQFLPDLASDTRYRVALSPLARDAAGNALAESLSFDVFTDGTLSRRPTVVSVGQGAVTLPGAVDGAIGTGGTLGPLADFSPIDLAHQVDRLAGPGFAGAIELRIQFSADVVETSLAANVSFEVILDNSPNLPRISVASATVISGTVCVITLAGAPFPSGGGTPLYRLRVRGGSGGLRDVYGNELAEDFLLYVTF